MPRSTKGRNRDPQEDVPDQHRERRSRPLPHHCTNVFGFKRVSVPPPLPPLLPPNSLPTVPRPRPPGSVALHCAVPSSRLPRGRPEPALRIRTPTPPPRAPRSSAPWRDSPNPAVPPSVSMIHTRTCTLTRTREIIVCFCFLSGWKMDMPGSPLLIGRSLSGVSPPHPRECLLDLYAELDSLGAAHPHAVHTRHHQTHTCDLPNVSPSRRTRRIEERTREGRGERHVL